MIRASLSVLAVDLAGKRLDLLREAISNLGRLAIMGNVGNPLTVLELAELHDTSDWVPQHQINPESVDHVAAFRQGLLTGTLIFPS